MGKRYFSLVAILLCSLCLFAKSVTGTGYGATEAEALTNARQNLIESFSVSVSSLTYLTSSDDGKDASSSSMANYSMQSTTFDLLGKSENVEKQSDGTFKATTTISSDAVPLYQAKLNDLYSAATSLNNIVSNAKDKTKEKNTYLKLISTLRDFETYRTVLLTLDSTAKVPTLTVSKAAVEAEYQSLLMQETNEMEITVLDFEQQMKIAKLSSKDQAAYNQALATLEENKRVKEELEKQKQEEYELKLLELQQQFQLNISQAQIDPSILAKQQEEGLSLTAIINRIEANRKTFFSIKEKMNEELANNETDYAVNLTNYVNEGMREAYSASETINGVPTESAKERRQERLYYKFSADEGALYEEKANIIYKEAFTRLSELSNITLDYIDTINKNKFSFSSLDDEVSTVIEGYNTVINSWYGTANVTVGNQTINLNFTIPYKEWTGNSIPAVRDYTAYDAYVAEANEWLNIMQSYPSSYYIDFDFEVVASATKPEYSIYFTKYEIIRGDNGNSVVTKNINQRDKITYDTNVNINDFKTTVNQFGFINYNDYKFVREEGKSTEQITISNQTDQATTLASKPTEEVYASKDISKDPTKKVLPKPDYVLDLGFEVAPTVLRPIDTTRGDLLFVLDSRFHFYEIIGMNLFIGFDFNVAAPYSFTNQFDFTDYSIYTGGTLSYFNPLTNIFQLYAGVSLGANYYKKDLVTEKSEFTFACDVAAGFVFNFKAVGIKLAAEAGYVRDQFMYGGNIGIIIPIK